MSVQTQIDRISEAVQSALAALTEKGVTVPDGTKVDGLAELIANIEAMATLTVNAPAGCTVTVSKDGKTNTKVAGVDGVAVFKGLETGEWTITITDVEQTAQKTVTITADYETAITFFAATINITYPAGSTCTATDGVTTLKAPDTSGTWACVVPNAGTWTVSLDNGMHEIVSIDGSGGDFTLNEWYLYNSGDMRITGGFAKDGATTNTGTTTYKENSNYLSLSSTGSNAYPNSKHVFYTAKNINMSNVNKIVSVVTTNVEKGRHIHAAVTDGKRVISWKVVGHVSMTECSLDVSAVDGIRNVGFGLWFCENSTYTIKLHSMKIVC